LAHMGCKEAVAALMEAVNDREPSVCEAVVAALGTLGDVRACDALIRCIGHDAAEVRLRAAEVLEALGQPQWKQWVKGDTGDFARLGNSGESCVVEPLVRALEHNSPKGRVAAARALGDTKNERAVEPLIKALSVDDYSCMGMRDAAIRSLGSIGGHRAVEALLNILRWNVNSGCTTLDERLRGAVVAALRAADSVMPLIEEMRRGTPNAAHALGEIGDRRAVDPLIEALKNRALQAEAIRALAKMGDKRAVDALIEVGRDSDALRALGKLGDSRAVGHLISALDKGSAAAADALGELGDASAIAPLIRALGLDGETRKAAAKALASLGQPQWERWIKGDEDDFARLGESREGGAVEVLVTQLGSTEGKARLAAANALKALGEPQWCNWIRGDKEDFVRLAAEGDGGAVDVVMKVIEDRLYDDDVREAAKVVAQKHGIRAAGAFVGLLHRRRDALPLLIAAAETSPAVRGRIVLEIVATKTLERLAAGMRSNGTILCGLEDRKKAAMEILRIIRSFPELPEVLTGGLVREMGVAHSDWKTHYDQRVGPPPNDCAHTDSKHGDSGIGINTDF
jgi:HEAT repeat protein